MKHPYHPHLIEAGCDEAGRGCLAGPVYAAAVILTKEISVPSFIRDSKKLSEAQRLDAAEWIRENSIAWALGMCGVDEIQRLNILWASVKAMHKALDALSASPDHVLVDGTQFQPWRDRPYTCLPGGDARVACIAAASILAKVARDAHMAALHRDYPQYGWLQNKGYATAEHRTAILRFGLSPWHRPAFIKKYESNTLLF